MVTDAKLNKECNIFTICSSLLTSQSGADIFLVALTAGTCTNKRKQFRGTVHTYTYIFNCSSTTLIPNKVGPLS